MFIISISKLLLNLRISNLFVTLQLQAAFSSSENTKAKEAKRKEPKARRKSSSAGADLEGELSVPEWMDF